MTQIVNLCQELRLDMAVEHAQEDTADARISMLGGILGAVAIALATDLATDEKLSYEEALLALQYWSGEYIRFTFPLINSVEKCSCADEE